jgi:hypothetical protein
MTHGNSGGPVLDEQGRVVGVATFGSVDPQTGREVAGLNFAVPVSVVSEMLKRAKVRPVEGAATEKYRLALDAFEKHWYKRALPLFKEVQRLDPAHPLVSKFIKDSQRAIAQGRDQTPREILGLPFVPVVASAALLGLLTVTIPARGLARRRRRARGRAGPGAPAQPGSAWPGAGWPEPGPSGQPDLPAWPDLPARPGPSARPGTAVYPVPTAPIGFNPNGNGSPAPAMAAGQATAAQPSAVQAWRPPSADDTAELPVATPAGRWDGHVPERRRPRQASPSLDCPSCGQPNPATNRFCEQCWSALRS